jgi:DNA mismatch endonuclease (patch repair protein)
MPDIVSKSKRSEIMAAIRSKGNKDTELKLAAIFRMYGIVGWRRQLQLPGHPDFVFSRQRVAVFVDGCFWHGCRWHCRMPKSRMGFWARKIARNKDRDKEVRVILGEMGWCVHRIWEHSLKTPERVVSRIKSVLASAPRGD